MASVGHVTVRVDMEPSEKVKELIAIEVEKQLAAKMDAIFKAWGESLQRRRRGAWQRHESRSLGKE